MTAAKITNPKVILFSNSSPARIVYIAVTEVPIRIHHMRCTGREDLQGLVFYRDFPNPSIPLCNLSGFFLVSYSYTCLPPLFLTQLREICGTKFGALRSISLPKCYSRLHREKYSTLLFFKHSNFQEFALNYILLSSYRLYCHMQA